MRITLLAFILVMAISITAAFTARGDEDTTIRRVLILGNSITRHAPAPRLGWYGDWGMAASSRDKDFVHILTRRLQQADAGILVDFANISLFERTYWQYRLSGLDSLRSLHPDLVILRIGENVDISSLPKHDFAACYQSLINYFKQDNDKVKLLCVSSFWKKEAVDTLIQQAARKEHCAYLKLSQLSGDPQYMALGQFKNEGVARHPSDRGMQAIADLIWEQVEPLIQ